MVADGEHANTDFTDANFRSAILSNAEFRGPKTKFGGADFSGADLSRATFEAPDFSQAILKGTSFREAILRGANFSNAVLSNVIFDGADLVGANFDGACVDGTVSFGRSQPRNLPRCNIVNSESPKAACVVYGYRDDPQTKLDK
jgi:uncharacterized protein YjbI with pentapeptide repeats